MLNSTANMLKRMKDLSLNLPGSLTRETAVSLSLLTQQHTKPQLDSISLCPHVAFNMLFGGAGGCFQCFADFNTWS